MINNLSKNFIVIYKDESMNDIDLTENAIINNSVLGTISNCTLKILNKYNNIIPNLSDIFNVVKSKGLAVKKLDSAFGVGHAEEVIGDLTNKNIEKIINNRDKVLELLDIKESSNTFEENLLKNSIKSVLNSDVDIVNTITNVSYNDRDNILKNINRINKIIVKLKILYLLENKGEDLHISTIVSKNYSNQSLKYILEKIELYNKSVFDEMIPFTKDKESLLEKVENITDFIYEYVIENKDKYDTIYKILEEGKDVKNISNPLEFVISMNKDIEHKNVTNIKFEEISIKDIHSEEAMKLSKKFFKENSKNYITSLVNSVNLFKNPGRDLISSESSSGEIQRRFNNAFLKTKYICVNESKIKETIEVNNFDISFNAKINILNNKNLIDSSKKKKSNKAK